MLLSKKMQTFFLRKLESSFVISLKQLSYLKMLVQISMVREFASREAYVESLFNQMLQANIHNTREIQKIMSSLVEKIQYLFPLMGHHL